MELCVVFRYSELCKVVNHLLAKNGVVSNNYWKKFRADNTLRTALLVMTLFIRVTVHDATSCLMLTQRVALQCLHNKRLGALNQKSPG
uniref:Uncharacterized protein n=1 Tax=Romanomermis culicivorax TaxID=13658 RepID=A0A915LBN5_ROMCU